MLRAGMANEERFPEMIAREPLIGEHMSASGGILYMKAFEGMEIRVANSCTGGKISEVAFDHQQGGEFT